MERLAEVTPPKPEADRLYTSFDAFRDRHPWVGQDNVKPKSIVRDLLEQAMTFKDFVNHYGLKRSEGVVLRYLSDCYKALIQNIPDEAKTDEIDDIIEWLASVIRQIDSSLIDEWERLIAPADEAETDGSEAGPLLDSFHDVTANHRAFRVMVRNELFRWVTCLATGQVDQLPDGAHPDELDDYWDEFDAIVIDAEARGPDFFDYDEADGLVTQTIRDPEGINAWRIEGRVDRERSAEEGTAVVDWIQAFSI
jgi:hypothetical protein